ncbi:TonB-dependent receptor [Chitinophaga sp. SYP-B3965]|uniref:TonB-dependent receptor n=1 Tax=Chitinophaga sp. SYP-B3965 TaxID=2663120 RepID=UPI0012995385|nr:TonB-dependent receptor [Chitinophaga sp. SYP-B3965]MRG43653.1 TonB-dependent receptor [Chitinophaga sp. SYP-B3965]
MGNKFNISVSLLLFVSFAAYAQRDTLPEVVVRSYLSKESLIRVPTATSILSGAQLQQQQGYSLVPAFNTIPGIRMEERSPGSYRLSMRGSLLRSPFGIRNIKIYMDEIPLTDAGGNAYLNLLDPGAVTDAEILKGPDGSLFGANSGGVIRLGVFDPPQDSSLRIRLQGGSYGLFHSSAAYSKQLDNYRLQLFMGYQRADGYRQNSALKRIYAQTAQQWEYKPGYNIKLLAFYTDMAYRTPGGLTLEQSIANPRAARVQSLTQQAAIYNRTFQGGLVHEAQISSRWKHTIAVFGANTHFENPFITNYEARDENTAGFRTFLEWQNAENPIRLKFNAGMEWQRTGSDIANYGNRQGVRDTLQVRDEINAGQHFYFARFSLQSDRSMLEGAASLNYYHFVFDRNGRTRIEFKPVLMPRLSYSYRLEDDLSLRVTVSRGYSPPATAEVRASNNVFNTSLQPETGWNYETGLRYLPRTGRYMLDVALFHYRMQNAIVRKLDDLGNEFFDNAGGTRQTGLEVQGSVWLCRKLELRSAYTFSIFKFDDYTVAGKDYSGNDMTGVPQHVVVTSVLWHLPYAFSLFAQHNFTSSIPLDDANTVYAKRYHLVQGKISWQHSRITLQAGVDNVLNEKYSLGNDLNALGGRYFNPAPGRNYFANATFSF